jgi:hypothetical protein
MTLRPILFSGAMVRAILDGTKTQTRRVVKLPTAKNLELRWDNARVDPGFTDPIPTGQYLHVEFRHKDDEWDGCMDRVYCPYGQPGDRLWVRETFALTGDNASPIVHPEHVGVAWRATDHPNALKWKPSIHMPRWASRITLEIVSVRVERLQEISADDAIAEGHPSLEWMSENVTNDAALDWYQDLWIDINGLESWKSNPFVWVLEFRRIQP